MASVRTGTNPKEAAVTRSLVISVMKKNKKCISTAPLKKASSTDSLASPSEKPPDAREKVAAAVEIASEYLCCEGRADCDKACAVAEWLPTYKDHSALTHLFGDNPELLENRQIRQTLLEANLAEKGGLLQRIAACPTHVRAQCEFAIEVALQPEFLTSQTRAEVSRLVVRMLAGSGLDPTDVLDPRLVAQGLTAVAADCLAAFVARYREYSALRPEEGNEEDERADNLEVGIQAFIDFCSRLTPLLAPQQFARFTTWAAHHGVHQVELLATQVTVPNRWPAPVGWRKSDQRYMGTRLTPLLSAKALKEEGEAMNNCLRDGRYNESAALGGLAFFSVKAAHSRATLSLKEVRQAHEVVRYEMDDLLGPHNDPASGECRQAAEGILDRLNGRLPLALSSRETRRREVFQQKTIDRRSFNPHIEAATERWERIYLSRLPKRARTSASQIVKDYLDA